MTLAVDRLKARRFFFLTVLLSNLFHLFWTSSIFALSISELQEKMAQSGTAIQSLQFNYVQEMRSSLSNEIQKSSGVAYFKKPKSLRIEQNDPEKQLIVTSGRSVFIYTPRFHQVMKDSWNRWFQKNSFFPGLIGFKETLQKLKKDYTWKIVGPADLNGEETLEIHLEGLSLESAGRLKLWLGAQDYIPRKSQLIAETLSITTTLVSLEKNLEFNPKLFVFQTPPESEVIEMP